MSPKVWTAIFSPSLSARLGSGQSGGKDNIIFKVKRRRNFPLQEPYSTMYIMRYTPHIQPDPETVLSLEERKSWQEEDPLILGWCTYSSREVRSRRRPLLRHMVSFLAVIPPLMRLPPLMAVVVVVLRPRPQSPLSCCCLEKSVTVGNERERERL